MAVLSTGADGRRDAFVADHIGTATLFCALPPLENREAGHRSTNHIIVHAGKRGRWPEAGGFWDSSVTSRKFNDI